MEILKSHNHSIRVEDDKLFDGEKEIKGEVDGAGMVIPFTPLDKGYDIARAIYRNFLTLPFENMLVLSGSGTSISSGGKTMQGLWEEIFTPASKTEDDDFFKEINFVDASQKNLEALLSQAIRASDVLDSTKSKAILARVKIIKDKIAASCKLVLSKDSPHLSFINKITSRKLKYPRAKIFTLNYDTLFEQAATSGNLSVINGFSFSTPSYFNGIFFDYDIVNREDSRVNSGENFVERVFHLYKPHGSVNWEKNDERTIINPNTENPHMIYPNANKYEYGYDQPFFEMTSRFQKEIRRPNTLLVCVGFSFKDKNFKNAILEAVKSNPGLNLFIAIPNFESKTEVADFLDLSTQQRNVLIVNESFEELVKNYPFSQEYGD